MNKLVSRYNKLSQDIKDLNEASSRYEGKLESFKESLKQAGFETTKEAEDWLEKTEKEKADIDFKVNNLLNIMEEIIEELDGR